jgi:putative ABC transport system permease protein
MIFANVAYVIFVRLETTSRVTGMDLENIFWISSQGYASNYDQQITVKLDLEFLNSLPGVVAASATNAVPQTFTGIQASVALDPELKGNQRSVLVYQMTDKFIDALGLHLVRGRSPSRDTFLPAPSGANPVQRLFGPEVVITEALADKLFGGNEPAMGKPLYFSVLDGSPATVVGIVERLQAAPFFAPGTEFVNEVVLAPAVPSGPNALYMVRTKPGLRNEVMGRVRREFETLQHGRYIDHINTLSSTASQARASDRNSAIVLAILSSLVLAVTMLGLFGYASFTVTTRNKEIGTRRAIGATKLDILKHFLLENWIITTAGMAVGSVITAVFALQLSMLLELPRLPMVFLASAMGLVWVTGLLAALIPALRAASVPPAVATRGA